MENKFLIKEIKRIQEVMYGKVLLKESPGSLNKLIELTGSLLKFSGSIAGKAKARGIKNRLNKYVTSLKRTGPRGGLITDYRKLTQVDDIKLVLKYLTGDRVVIDNIMPFIQKRYKTEKLFQGDEGYELQKFVKSLQEKEGLRKHLHADFMTEFDKTMKIIDKGEGVIKSFIIPIVKITRAQFKNSMGVMSNKELRELESKLIKNLGPNMARAFMVDLRRIVSAPLKALRWLAAGKTSTKTWWEITKTVGTRLIYLVLFVTIAEVIDRIFFNMDNLLSDGGTLWASLPPEAKEIFGIEEEEAKKRAQALWDELQKINPDEGVIYNLLSMDGEGSKLIANQIAYEFGLITPGDLTLMQIMDKNLTIYFDKVATAIQQTFNWQIPWTDGNFTSTDIMAKLNSETFPAVNAPLLNLEGKMKEIAEEGFDDIATFAAFRVGMPKAIDNYTAAIYSNKGRYMTPDQLAYLTKVFDMAGMTGEYDGRQGFLNSLIELDRDDFRNQDSDDKFIVIDGTWKDGRFKARDEKEVSGENSEVNTENNEADLRSQYDTIISDLQGEYDNWINRMTN